MKQPIEKKVCRKVYETPAMKVLELDTCGRLLQGSQLPFSPIPGGSD